MLIQYAVSNYKSIKDEIVINFTAEQKDDEWVTECENKLNKPLYIYKAVGLVGPNASGKSNILDSFIFALRFINSSFTRKENRKINVEPFLLDPLTKMEDSTFEFIFMAGGTKYVYGFSVNEECVNEEYLYAYYSSRATTIFNREIGDKYDFRGTDLKVQNEIKSKMTKNRLYLPVAAEWGYERLKEPYNWFGSLTKQYMKNSIKELIQEVLGSEHGKRNMLDLIQKADINVANIGYKIKEVNEKEYNLLKRLIDEVLSTMDESEGIRDISIPTQDIEIYLEHEGKDGEIMRMPLEEDSAGTISAVENIAEILYLGLNGGMMLEDELGKTYHSRLLKYILQIFRRKEYNSADAQLFFTTHNTKVFKYLEPAQIYLVDKEADGSTFVKLLDDYKIDKEEDVELGYLLGRFGAVPYTRG